MGNVISGHLTTAPLEYVDYLLIKHLYHCTPSQLDEQDEFTTDLHGEFMRMEAKEDIIQQKRAEQKAKMQARRR